MTLTTSVNTIATPVAVPAAQPKLAVSVTGDIVRSGAAYVFEQGNAAKLSLELQASDAAVLAARLTSDGARVTAATLTGSLAEGRLTVETMKLPNLASNSTPAPASSGPVPGVTRTSHGNYVVSGNSEAHSRLMQAGVRPVQNIYQRMR